MSGYGIIPYKPVEAGAVRQMTEADAKVYIAICAHVRAKTWQANPGSDRLAELTGLSGRAVRLAIRRLEGIGVLQVQRGGGRTRKSLFLLTGNPERPFPLSRNPEPRNPECRRTETRNAGSEIAPTHQSLEELSKNGAAPAPSETPNPEQRAAFTLTTPKPTQPSGNGAAGRIMTAWCAGFKAATGSDFSPSARGKTAGLLKSLAAGFAEGVLTQAVQNWFAKPRADYGIELFKMRLEGGNADLRAIAPATQIDEYAVAKLARLRGQNP